MRKLCILISKVHLILLMCWTIIKDIPQAFNFQSWVRAVPFFSPAASWLVEIGVEYPEVLRATNFILKRYFDRGSNIVKWGCQAKRILFYL